MVKILANLDIVPNLSIDILNAKDLTKEQFYKHYIDNNKPCLIKDAIKHWPACSKWSDFNYLKKLSGHNIVNRHTTVNYTGDNEFSNATLTKRAFSEALLEVEDDSIPIVSIPGEVITTTESFSELRKDMGEIECIKNTQPPMQYPDARFFVYKNAGTGWHSHPVDETLMCQIAGDKKVSLFTTKDGDFQRIAKLADNERYQNGSHFLSKFKQDINLAIITVRQGDALYIPPFWWHAVDPVDEKPGITLARCFRSPLHKTGDISYPQIRQLWDLAWQKPNRFTPLVLGSVMLSKTLHIVRKCKRYFINT